MMLFKRCSITVHILAQILKMAICTVTSHFTVALQWVHKIVGQNTEQNLIQSNYIFPIKHQCHSSSIYHCTHQNFPCQNQRRQCPPRIKEGSVQQSAETCPIATFTYKYIPHKMTNKFKLNVLNICIVIFTSKTKRSSKVQMSNAFMQLNEGIPWHEHQSFWNVLTHTSPNTFSSEKKWLYKELSYYYK
jgi:hypothetical protein